MNIKELFNKSDNNKKNYYQYLRKPTKNNKLDFLKSKSFIFIVAAFFTTAAIIIVFQFRTTKKIQKLIYNQKFDRAIKVAGDYLKKNENPEVSFLLAESLFIKSFYVKNSNETEQYQSRALNILSKFMKKKKDKSSIELFTYGFLLIKKKEDMDKGVDFLKLAIKENKEDGKLGAYINRRIIKINNKPLQFVDIYERIAFTLYRLKRFHESLNYYRLALKTRPKTIHYFFMALVNKNLKNFDKAEKLIKLVLNTEANEDVKEKCFLLLANIEFKRENFQKAEKFYKKTLEINSQSANSYYFLGKIYRRQRKIKRYRSYLRKAAELGHKKAKTMFPSYELKEMKKKIRAK
jgi:tetratricopeptide (TPR) repeat protein